MNEGAAEPLGVHFLGHGAQVAIPAPGVEALEICIFEGEREVARHRLRGRTGDVIHGVVPGLGEGSRYGLRAHGPWDPARGLRCNPAKLLLDPWARAIDRPFALHPALFDADMAPDATDSAPFMPKAVLMPLLPPAAPCSLPPGPRVIYELHVRGFTRLHPDIPERIRGTFAGLAHPAAIAYLRRLGITHVELMPSASWVDERHLPPIGLANYWGYNPIGFLAPDPRLAPGGMAEVRAAVAALQTAGIGVILDIVLNHSGESDEAGPTLSLRGLGDAAWYRGLPDAPGRYANETGCGNSLALDRPWPLRLAMDAMRHWVSQAGLDGLRLDLATTLGRRDNGFDADAPLLLAMRQDPVLRDRLIIAEPWDIGRDGHRLGAFPPGWGEWNDRFRDDVRRFWRGDGGMLGALATRLAGSRDIFAERASTDSVNFVTAHDGFTLADLVSHTGRHNNANGEQGRDGAGENYSWNCGVEGTSDDPAVTADRNADARALMATLLAARGTPMLVMGDEAGRSQGGNNNAYCQDNPLSWFDWEGADAALVGFAARLVAARRAHPALHGARPLTGAPEQVGTPDVLWLRLDGAAMQEVDWHAPDARSLAMLLAVPEDRVLVVVHGAVHAVELHLPEPRWGQAWYLLADSAAPERVGPVGARLAAAPRSVLLLVERPRAPRPRDTADPALLARLAQAAGVATDWHDLSGRRTEVPDNTLRAILGALGLPAETAAQARESLAHRRSVALAPMPAAGTCQPLPPGRHFAVVAQTFGLRHATDQGIGDYTALAQLAVAAGTNGATLVGLSPPHALMPVGRERASPYQPSDRRFLEPVLLDVTAISDLPAVKTALEQEAGLFATLRKGVLVDYATVWAAKRRVLAAAWETWPSDDAGLAAFCGAGGSALEDFATFSALAERHNSNDHRAWGPGHAHPGDSAVLAFRASDPKAIGFHAFLQFLCDQQLAAAAAAGPGLYRDLAVGSAPDGAEIWSQPDAFLRGFSIGAPPDPFAPQGQVWGLPVPNPHVSAADGHAGFGRLLAANMRHARALRLDHAMGLERLFVVPDGAPGQAGCYLSFDGAGMLGLLARESQAAGCAVIGEALGTVPEGMTGRLEAAGVAAYRVLWFEREGDGFRPPKTWPVAAAACISTHDLAPLAGWWEGADIAERASLGLLDADGKAAALETRAADRVQLLRAVGRADPVFTPGLAAAIHAFVASSRASMMLVQAEDLVAERIGINLPGTDSERPNWRRRLTVEASQVFAGDFGVAILQAVAAARPGSTEAALP